MRPSRFSLGSIGFAVLVLAVDFAVIRSVFLDDRPEDGALFALFLLPMIDALMIVLYRLRRRERRTPRAIGFLAVGSVATALVFACSLLAPWAVEGTIVAVLQPVARLSYNGLTRLLGNAAMQTRAGQLAIGVGFEILLPTAFFCLPPLVAGLLGGWVARRIGDGGWRSTSGTPVPRPFLVGSAMRTVFGHGHRDRMVRTADPTKIAAPAD